MFGGWGLGDKNIYGRTSLEMKEIFRNLMVMT